MTRPFNETKKEEHVKMHVKDVTFRRFAIGFSPSAGKVD